jgi:hypothetical protein
MDSAMMIVRLSSSLDFTVLRSTPAEVRPSRRYMPSPSFAPPDIPAVPDIGDIPSLDPPLPQSKQQQHPRAHSPKLDVVAYYLPVSFSTLQVQQGASLPARSAPFRRVFGRPSGGLSSIWRKACEPVVAALWRGNWDARSLALIWDQLQTWKESASLHRHLDLSIVSLSALVSFVPRPDTKSHSAETHRYVAF